MTSCWTSELNIWNIWAKVVGNNLIISLINMSVHITCYASAWHTPVIPVWNIPSLVDRMFAEKECLDTTDRFLWHGGIQKCESSCIVLDIWTPDFCDPLCSDIKGLSSDVETVLALILSFFVIDSGWENTQPATCEYYTITKSTVIWLVLPPFCNCPQMENYSYTRVHSINHCHLERKGRCQPTSDS